MNRLDGLALGAAPPDDINVVVTATVGSEPLSLRLDRVSGLLTVTRLFHSAMRYPGNHGLVPQTRSENGEPDRESVGRVATGGGGRQVPSPHNLGTDKISLSRR